MTPEQALAALRHTALSSHPPAQATGSARRARQPPPSPSETLDLTEREVEVLRLVAQGLTDAQVADALVISPRTVNAHLRSIYMLSRICFASISSVSHMASKPFIVTCL